jgi:hypothetical protein
VHAIGNVFIDGQGRWLWHYQYQPSKTGAAVETGSITESNAELMGKRLARSVQSIIGQLRCIREKRVEQSVTQADAITD